MEKKKNFIKAMEYGKYLAFVLATIFVIVAQFVGGKHWIMIALALYSVAFGFLFATLVIHLVELYDADKQVKNMNAEIVLEHDTEHENRPEDENKSEFEVVNLKKEKVWTMIGSIFFGIFTIFTLVVLFIY